MDDTGSPAGALRSVHRLDPRHQRSIIHRQGAKPAKGTPGSFGSAFICLIRVIGVLAFHHRDHRGIH